MRTYIIDGIITALSSISHNGGEKNGIVTQLRREVFVQPDLSTEDVPVISGNSIRGTLRDKAMLHMLAQLGYKVYNESEVQGLSQAAFDFLMSGGNLVKSEDKKGSDLNLDYYRRLKHIIPAIGLFGGAAGNAIMPGKIGMGKIIPLCKETAHLLPGKVVTGNERSIWEYCQAEMNVRKDDKKDDRYRHLLAQPPSQSAQIQGDASVSTLKKTVTRPQQMMYYTETLAAGTRFYWKIVLEDVTDIEFEAFILTLIEFSKRPVIGGKSGTGHGDIAMKLDKWLEIDSRTTAKSKDIDFTLGTKYMDHLEKNGEEIRSFLSKMN